jgi:hypothetical protein
MEGRKGIITTNTIDGDSIVVRPRTGKDSTVPHILTAFNLEAADNVKEGGGKARAIVEEKASNLETTPELDKYKLAFNLKYKLFICLLCQEGLPFRSVTTHLQAKTLKRWSEIEAKHVKCETGHLPCPEFNKVDSAISKTFRNTLVQSLIDAGHITSIVDIADASGPTEWHEKFPDRPDQLGVQYDHITPEPIEGIKSRSGFYCYECNYGSSIMKTIRSYHSDKNVSYAGHIVVQCHIQTFSEIFPKFFPAAYIPKDQQNIAPDSSPDLTIHQLLQRAKSRVLSKVPTVVQSPSHILLPIYSNSGIDRWLMRFDRTALPGLLPEVPHSSKKCTPEAFIRLWHITLELFIEDMTKIKEVDVHHTVLHHLTNATP